MSTTEQGLALNMAGVGGNSSSSPRFKGWGAWTAERNNADAFYSGINTLDKKGATQDFFSDMYKGAPNTDAGYTSALDNFNTDTVGMLSGTALTNTTPSQPWYKNETMVGLGLGAANIGLGFASFLENKKTGKLHREGMRHDLGQARNDAARQQAQIDYVKQRSQNSAVV